MIEFKNGLIIKGNPRITKENNFIKISNDFGLNFEFSLKVWESITN